MPNSDLNPNSTPATEMAEANERALLSPGPDLASPGLNIPTHILEGTFDFAIPNAFVEGTAPPLTAKPYQLSRGYSHLVESPDEHKDVIVEKVGKIQSTLAQLGFDDLRQAKADIIYLRSILDGEGMDVAQVRAGAVWASREV